MATNPACAQTCLVQSIPGSSCSTWEDYTCVCTNVPLILDIQNCGWEACGIKDVLRGMNYLYATCQYPVKDDTTALISVLGAGFALASIAVTIRVVGRVMGSTLGLDDVAIMLSMGVETAMSVIGFIYPSIGLGKDIWFVPFPQITDILLLFYLEQVLYVASTALTKISMLLLFLRVFPSERFQLITKITLAFVTLWGIALLFANIFQCTPVSYSWTYWDREHSGSCRQWGTPLLAHSVVNVLLDVVIMVLPLPTLLRMQIPWARKGGVCAMFAVWIVAAVVAILRLLACLRFDIRHNPTRDITTVAIWSLTEVNLSIICACMPGIRAFFKFAKHRLCYTKASSGAGSSGPWHSGSGGVHDQGRDHAQQHQHRYALGPGVRNRNSNVPDPSSVRDGTFASANREQGEFIKLAELEMELGWVGKGAKGRAKEMGGGEGEGASTRA
ncbi:CFEM domain-containing protein [Aspergillus stella-maris]|uniref:CFEM domain-containing protein n=1 Tax=Aspergillus stella-maris TaxID=1810926 RepID=UPI003CCE4FC3